MLRLAAGIAAGWSGQSQGWPRDTAEGTASSSTRGWDLQTAPPCTARQDQGKSAPDQSDVWCERHWEGDPPPKKVISEGI